MFSAIRLTQLTGRARCTVVTRAPDDARKCARALTRVKVARAKHVEGGV